MVRIESATERSSLYQPYMISKLGGSSDPNFSPDKVKKTIRDELKKNLNTQSKTIVGIIAEKESLGAID